MSISINNAAWLLPVFIDERNKLPKSRRYEPYYNATSWDFDDLMLAFRREAIESGSNVWGAFDSFCAYGKWPKLDKECAFWLRERWLMAEQYCRLLLATSGDTKECIIGIKPDSLINAFRYLLIDLWDSSLVDEWLINNARRFVTVERFAPQEALVDYEIAMREFEKKRTPTRGKPHGFPGRSRR